MKQYTLHVQKKKKVCFVFIMTITLILSKHCPRRPFNVYGISIVIINVHKYSYYIQNPPCHYNRKYMTKRTFEISVWNIYTISFDKQIIATTLVLKYI